MKKAVCQYSVIRFLPYRETEEFVNVGILLLCEALGILRFRLETRRHKRITDFFGELDSRVFRSGVRGLEAALWQTLPRHQAFANTESALPGTSADLKHLFDSLVRPRRTLFYFSEPRVVASTNPAETLNSLFCHYVERRFAQAKEYQEELMRESIHSHLVDWRLDSAFQPREFESDVYRMRFPFVHAGSRETRADHAIRPLHLGLRDTTEILRKGDLLIGGLRRLADASALPGRCMFVVKRPRGDAKIQAVAEQVCEGLNSIGLVVVDYSDKSALQSFVEEVREKTSTSGLELPAGVVSAA